MLDTNRAKSMMFHVKQNIVRDTKKLQVPSEKTQIQELWARIEAAFRSVDKSISRPGMIKLIEREGESVSVGTFNSYASGRNWPHIRILKAVSRATSTSLDELVFGSSGTSSTVREVTELLRQMERVKNQIQNDIGLGPSPTSAERIELLEAIAKLKPEQLKLVLDLTKGLRVT